MNRRPVYALLVVTLLLPFLSTAAEARISIVDMEQLFASYYKTVRADASLEQQKQLYKEHFQDQAEKIEAIKTERDQLKDKALNIALSEDVRQKSRREAEENDKLYVEKKKELEEFIRAKDKELGQLYMKQRGDIVQEITAFLADYAKRHELGLILDASGMSRNMVPVVIYRDASLDITDPVLAELNSGHEDEVKQARQAEQAQ